MLPHVVFSLLLPRAYHVLIYVMFSSLLYWKVQEGLTFCLSICHILTSTVAIGRVCVLYHEIHLQKNIKLYNTFIRLKFTAVLLTLQ